MFFFRSLEYELLLEPCHFGAKLKDIIRTRLIDEVEGTCLGKNGYVISVTEMSEGDITPGVIEYDSGFVNFSVKYNAILFRPFKNEVLDTRVTTVNELGFWADVGPISVFVSRHNMPRDIENGYDADADAWISEDREVELRPDCIVRLRVLGVQCDVNEITVIGTIKDDFLGLIATEEY